MQAILRANEAYTADIPVPVGTGGDLAATATRALEVARWAQRVDAPVQLQLPILPRLTDAERRIMDLEGEVQAARRESEATALALRQQLADQRGEYLAAIRELRQVIGLS
jgi:hypothetical protein